MDQKTEEDIRGRLLRQSEAAGALAESLMSEAQSTHTTRALPGESAARVVYDGSVSDRIDLLTEARKWYAVSIELLTTAVHV